LSYVYTYSLKIFSSHSFKSIRCPDNKTTGKIIPVFSLSLLFFFLLFFCVLLNSIFYPINPVIPFYPFLPIYSKEYTGRANENMKEHGARSREREARRQEQGVRSEE
jgi:hypothetical protein